MSICRFNPFVIGRFRLHYTEAKPLIEFDSTLVIDLDMSANQIQRKRHELFPSSDFTKSE